MTFVHKTIQVSRVELSKISPAHYIVCPLPRAKSVSVSIYSLFAHLHQPPTPFPFEYNRTVASVYVSLFDGHSDRCEVISHCGFNMHFSDGEWCWASFHMSVGHLYVLFGEVSVQALYLLLGLFVFLVLSYVGSLYILEINPLSDVSLANTVSHTVGFLFIFCWFIFLYKSFLVWWM